MPEGHERAELEQRLRSVLDDLKPGHKSVIMQRSYAQATWGEIAKVLGLGSEGAARQLHARAMVELALRMGN